MSRHQICHAHCPDEGGGLAVLAAVLAVALILVAGAVHHEVHQLRHLADEAVTIGAIIIGSSLGLAILAVVGVKLARSEDFRRALADPVAREREIARAAAPAIEAPRPDLADRAYFITDLADKH
jgi:anaerobic C4-dicarboxylate transporter